MATLTSCGPAGAADARRSRHEPHSSHERLTGAAWSRRRTRGTRAELLTPPFGARHTHRLQGEQHRSTRRALVVSADTSVHQALAAAYRPFEPSPHLSPAWHPSAPAPLESCSLPAAVRRLAGALALRGVGAPPACCELHPRRPCVEGARLLATRSGSQWWSSQWAWLAGACGPRSRRGAGPHCALPPNTDVPPRAARHARRHTKVQVAAHTLSLVSTVSCVLRLVVLVCASLKGVSVRTAAEGQH